MAESSREQVESIPKKKSRGTHSMSDPLWVHKPSVLLDEKRLGEFWPTERMSCNERVNAFSRFILYFSAVMYVFSSKVSYVLLGAIALLVIGLISRSRKDSRELFANYPHIHESSDARFQRDPTSRCLLPTPENPFGNVPVNELSSRTLPACNYKDVSDKTNDIMSGLTGTRELFQSEVASRQFYQMPVTESISDTDKFGKFLYGQGPNCKSDPSVCTGFDLTAKSNVPFPFM